MSALSALREHLGTLHDLNSSAALLEWDQETYMPEGATPLRATQVATLRRMAHEGFVGPETARLLDAARAAAEDEQDVALVAVTGREYERARKLPSAFVAEMAETVGHAKAAWRAARQHDDFSRFAPHLETLVGLNRRQADLLGYADHPYDALLDLYEPGLTTAEVRRVFGELRDALVPLVGRIAARPQPDLGPVRGFFDEKAQWDFGMQVLRDVGFDFERGRQDVSAHPFTTTFGTSDVRLTTRIDTGFFPTAFFGTLHEAGHGLYEQGIDPAFDRTPLAEGTSLGMHESQSRLWENGVGRSRAFWEHYYPILQRAFPDALGRVALDDFHAALRHVAPSPIRVEADEVTYNLHIMLRFELEVALVEGTLAVSDLPAAWNDGMEAYLGVRPQNNADGVLQDVHWSLGTLGYFPTYTLGNLMSAMLYEAAERDLGPLDAHFREGRFGPLLGWLREHVHRHGRSRSAARILRDATGEALSARAWLLYIENVYGADPAGG